MIESGLGPDFFYSQPFVIFECSRVMNIQLSDKEKVYFASDFHLGVPSYEKSREREDRIIRWLDQIKTDAQAIFLVGDLFDFWFEYKHTIPKGFTRFLGKLAELSDAGIDLHIFVGNHDLWMFGYFEQELNAKVYHDPITLTINGSSIYLAHGDGLGPGDRGYKRLKKMFTNSFFQWSFNWLHPDIGISIANAWSKRSRAQANHVEQSFLGDDEWLWQFAKDKETEGHHDYYLFGHRHLPLDLAVGDRSRYINIGEWLSHNSYAVFDGESLKLCYFES
jgi:UDP-2,3-diacylglucosamine hydrolase